jgi:hypothetical protein
MRSRSRRKEFYVYLLLDPRKLGKHRYGRWVFPAEPFYVGKGKDYRAYYHTRYEKGVKSHKTHKIKAIEREGHEVITCFKRKGLTDKQALALEIKLIARIGRANLKAGPLCNHTDGGDGASGLIATAATRRKLRDVQINRTQKEKDAIRAKRSAALKEVWANRTAKEKAAIMQNRSAVYTSRTTREKTALKRKIGIANKNVWNSKSAKEKLEHGKRMSLIAKTWRNKDKASSDDSEEA